MNTCYIVMYAFHDINTNEERPIISAVFMSKEDAQAYINTLDDSDSYYIEESELYCDNMIQEEIRYMTKRHNEECRYLAEERDSWKARYYEVLDYLSTHVLESKIELVCQIPNLAEHDLEIIKEWIRQDSDKGE